MYLFVVRCKRVLISLQSTIEVFPCCHEQSYDASRAFTLTGVEMLCLLSNLVASKPGKLCLIFAIIVSKLVSFA